MSMTLMAHAMSLKVGNPLRKLVLLKLADNANDQGECWPSVPYIAEQCEISPRSVQNHIDALAEAGFLWIESRKTAKGLNQSNIYHLTLNRANESGGANAAPVEEKPVQSGASPAGVSGANAAPYGAGAAGVSGAGAAPRTSHSLEPVNEPLTPIVPAKKFEAEVEQVFAFWKVEFNHPRAKLDSKRKSKITSGLKNGFSVDELCNAIAGAKFNSWLMGKNPDNTIYDDLVTLLRDVPQIEKLKALHENPQAKAVASNEYSAITARNIQAMQGWSSENSGAPF